MDIYIPFGWFYLFNLVFLTLFLLFYGIRRGYPMPTWFTLLAWMLFFFLIGLKIMNFPVGRWGDFLFNDLEEPVYQKFLPGGVLFLAVGLFLIKLLLGFKKPVMDGLILVIPLAVAVQRAGCFLNGCCFGQPSDLPWAVSYPPGTSAYVHYLNLGLVQPGDAVSCTIHPAQLYTLIGSLVLFALIWSLRNRWRSRGARVLSGLLFFVVLRFIIEFFRATDPAKWYAGEWLGVNLLQWILLILALPLTILLAVRERRPQVTMPDAPYRENLLRTSGALLLLILLMWNFGRLFELHELLLSGLLLALAVTANLLHLFRMVGKPLVRYGAVTLLLVAFGTMGQDVIRSEADTVKRAPDKVWFNIGIGGSSGRYEDVVRDCSGTITERRLKQETSGNLNLAVNYQPHPNHHMEYGLNLWANSDRFVVYDGEDILYLGVIPYARYDLTLHNREWLSLLLGLNVAHSNQQEYEYEPGTEVMPVFYLRVGPRDRFFADMGLGNQILLTGKPDIFQFGFGAGLGKQYPARNTLRFGFSIGPYDVWYPEDYMHLYVAGDFRITEKMAVKPGIYVGNKLFGTLGLSFDLGRQAPTRWPKAPPAYN